MGIIRCAAWTRRNSDFEVDRPCEETRFDRITRGKTRLREELAASPAGDNNKLAIIYLIAVVARDQLSWSIAAGGGISGHRMRRFTGAPANQTLSIYWRSLWPFHLFTRSGCSSRGLSTKSPPKPKSPSTASVLFLELKLSLSQTL